MTDGAPVLRPDLKLILYSPLGQDVGSPDLPDLIDWVPRDPEQFGVQVTLYIGTTDDDASDTFEMTVCSPDWFVAHWEEETDASLMPDGWPASVTFGKDFWFMRRWDAAEVMAGVTYFLSSASASTWAELASVLALNMRWDHEGE